MNYNSIKLEKGMYGVRGKSFTQVLEELDPSENYKNTSLDGLDAYQRQLKRFDIKVSGKNSDSVAKFFNTTNSAALFPEYINRAVRAGMDENVFIDDIVASTTQIDSLDYRSITCTDDDDFEISYIAEGAKIPETNIKTRNNLVHLFKRGRMLVTSYEAIKFQRLDLFTVTIKQIGTNIAKIQLQDAIDVLIDGDGNNNSIEDINTTTSGTLTYADLLSLWALFEKHELNVLLASPNSILKMAKLSEFQNPLTGLNFAGTGKLSTPLGADLYKSNKIPDDIIIGLDRKCALEKIECGNINIDYDRIIDRQLERAAITSIAGFAKIFDDASKMLII